MQIPIEPLLFLLLIVASISVFSKSKKFQKYPTDQSLFSAQAPFRNTAYRLTKPPIGDDGWTYTFEKILFAFETNGSIAWCLHLNYPWNVGMAPIHGGRGKDPVAKDFFGPGPGQQGPSEIIGLAVGTLSAYGFINIRNRGLFVYLMHGQLLWSLGPVLLSVWLPRGCRKTVTDCYFISVPVIHRCDARIHVMSTHA